jgi:hypothetical protein
VTLSQKIEAVAPLFTLLVADGFVAAVVVLDIMNGF